MMCSPNVVVLLQNTAPLRAHRIALQSTAGVARCEKKSPGKAHVGFPVTSAGTRAGQQLPSKERISTHGQK